MKNDTAKIYKLYHENEEDTVRQKQSDCHHKMWIKKCSTCGLILDCEHLHEETVVDEVII